MYGRAFVKNGDWFVEYRTKTFPIVNHFPPDDHRYLAIGRDENSLVHFNKMGEIERIGSVRPLMAKSLAIYCRKSRPASMFSTKSGRPTIDLQTMKDARLIRVGDRIKT